jgi:hypothetical protein
VNGSVPATAASRPAIGPKTSGRARYFLAVAFFLSCFGFMLFLSFFCELLPLPMFTLHWTGMRNWLPASRTVLSFGRISADLQS